MQEKLLDCPQILERLTEKQIGKQVAATAPKVSVIIPAYNVALFIKETLDSVFAQTFTDFEVILVNDGSTDTKELKVALAPYFEQIVYAEQINSGASQARNAAICLSRGELLAFLDGDDIWNADFLESQTNFLEKNNFEMVYCDALLFGASFLAGRTYMQDAPSGGAVTTKSLISADCNVITSGTVLKKDLLNKFNMFDTNLSAFEDFDLWFRLVKGGTRIAYQSKVLIKYRVRSNSLSGTNVDRATRSIVVLKVIHEKYNLDDAELELWEKQMAFYKAVLELEKSKLCLAQGEFAEARIHIFEANKFYKKPKLFLINGLMRFSPRLTLRLFKAIRPEEFSFISPNES